MTAPAVALGHDPAIPPRWRMIVLPANRAAFEDPAVEIVDRWLRRLVARPHPDLGRPGPVCPFVPPALQIGAVHYAVVRGCTEQPDVIESIRRLLHVYEVLEPTGGKGVALKTCIAIFPDLAPAEYPEMILGTQRRLKTEFVARGLMLGEFFPGYSSPGIRNSRFHPLDSPAPLLVIRQMVRTDDLFLKERGEWLESYRRHFSRESGR